MAGLRSVWEIPAPKTAFGSRSKFGKPPAILDLTRVEFDLLACMLATLAALERRHVTVLEGMGEAGVFLYLPTSDPSLLLPMSGSPAQATDGVAGGIEAFTLKSHLGLRAGLSGNTIGAARVSPSVGASLGVKTSLYLDVRIRHRDIRRIDGSERAVHYRSDHWHG